MKGALRNAAAPLLVAAYLAVEIVLGWAWQWYYDDGIDRGAQPRGGAPPAAASDAPVRYADDARALLGGLDVGDDLGGWTVTGARGPEDGTLFVDLERVGVRFTLLVVRDRAWERPAVVHTERFDLYYSEPVPPDAGLAFDELASAIDALEARIDREAPVPDGM